MKKFNERSRQNLSELNKEMLATWEAENLFQRSVAMREGAPSFVFLRGSALRKRYARHTPCDGSHHQRPLLPL